MKWKGRLALLAFGGYILAQGVGNLNAHHYVYWNVSRRFVLYPETQIIAGAALIVIALTPLEWIVRRLTAPYLRHHPTLKPFWKRHHKQVSIDE